MAELDELRARLTPFRRGVLARARSVPRSQRRSQGASCVRSRSPWRTSGAAAPKSTRARLAAASSAPNCAASARRRSSYGRARFGFRSRLRGRGRGGADPAEADEARRRFTGQCGRAGRRRRPRAARRDGRAAGRRRETPAGQPARARGVRGGEGAAGGARRPACGSRGEPRGAREAPQRADGDGRATLRRDLRRRQPPLRGRDGDRLPGRRGPPPPH